MSESLVRRIALAIVACFALPVAHADAVAELDDAAARLQYAFYTGDARDLEEVLALLDRLEASATLLPMKEYYSAYGNWKLAQLHAQESTRGSAGASASRSAAGKAAQACVKHSEAAIKGDARLDEAHAINAVCASFGTGLNPLGQPSFGGCARSKALRTAQQIAPDNPRIMLIEAICLGGSDAAAATASFDKLRDTIRAFEAAAPSRPGRPDWGQAEALVLLGQSYLQRGDSLAARDAIERALVLAPDYRKAQELLHPAATRPR
jgi:tetratricopeptide (TPR) repeat protein